MWAECPYCGAPSDSGARCCAFCGASFTADEPGLLPAASNALEELLRRKVRRVQDLLLSKREITIEALERLGLDPVLKQALIALGPKGCERAIRGAAIRALQAAGLAPVDSGQPMGRVRRPARREAAPAKGKRGKRSRYSQGERDQTVMDWERLDKENTAQNLTDFLVDRFGDDDDFRPFVARSTFYDWRRKFYRRHPDWTPEEAQRNKP